MSGETEEEEGRRPIMFDTLSAVRRLRDAGFEQAQAEALATAILETAVHEFATKTYVDAALARLASLLTARLCAAAIVIIFAIWLILRG
jgi:hypothetical protein